MPRGEHLSVQAQIGLFSYPDGAFRPVTNDLTDHSSLSLSADGHTLATVRKETSTQIILMPSSGAGPSRPCPASRPVKPCRASPGPGMGNCSSRTAIAWSASTPTAPTR